MQKVYFLLRSNREMGPYTIHELLQQALPTDLIWIEGKSLAWAYAAEIKELKDFSDNTNPVRSDEVHPISNSNNEDEIESRAEELRQKILSFKPQYCFTTTFTNDKVYLGSFNSIEESKTQGRIYRKKEVPAYEWLSAFMVMLMVVAGVYGGQKYLAAKSRVLPQAVVRETAIDSHAAKTTKHEQTVATIYKEPIPDTVASVVLVKKKTLLPKQKKLAAAKASLAKIMKEAKAPVNNEEVLVPLVKENKIEPPKMEAVQTKAAVVEPIEKKKTLGQVFKGLFKKKKKTDEKSTVQEATSVQSQDN